MCYIIVGPGNGSCGCILMTPVMRRQRRALRRVGVFVGVILTCESLFDESEGGWIRSVAW